jgi:hypothetical protein
MPEFLPVATIMDFQTLDEAEVLLGYMEGFDGSPVPGSGASRAFYHGWRNGMVDGGFAQPDESQRQLAAALGSQRYADHHASSAIEGPFRA